MRRNGSGGSLDRHSSGDNPESMKVNSGPELGVCSNPFLTEGKRILSAPQMTNKVSHERGNNIDDLNESIK